MMIFFYKLSRLYGTKAHSDSSAQTDQAFLHKTTHQRLFTYGIANNAVDNGGMDGFFGE
jgi:hypothetical protein